MIYTSRHRMSRNKKCIIPYYYYYYYIRPRKVNMQVKYQHYSTATGHFTFKI